MCIVYGMANTNAALLCESVILWRHISPASLSLRGGEPRSCQVALLNGRATTMTTIAIGTLAACGCCTCIAAHTRSLALTFSLLLL